jgi:DNA-binding LacI/PurR family transcriptional regulator
MPYSAHTVDARVGGYQEALHCHLGLEAQALVKWTDPTDVGAVRDFVERARPDAIICANDYTAAQLMITLNSIGIQVPFDIRVAGIDDVKYARLLQTPLTTIRQPCLEIGSTALLAMLDRIAHPATPSREFVVDFQLVIRKSTEVNTDEQSDSSSNHGGRNGDAAKSQPAKEVQGQTLDPGGTWPVRADKF